MSKHWDLSQPYFLLYLVKYELRKQLVETLIWSELDYADLVFYLPPQFLLRCLQRVQFAATSFILSHYVKNFWDALKSDGFQSMREEIWISWNHALKLCITLRLKITKQECRKELLSSNSIRLVVPTKNGTFQDNASKLFNNLPETIRNCKDYRTFLRNFKEFFM